MAETTVQIEIDEQGKFSVGLVPPEAEVGDEGPGDRAAGPQPGPRPVQAQAQALMGGPGASGAPGGAAVGEEAAEADYMKPVGSIDEALAMAKQILTQAAGASQDDQMQQGFGNPGAPATMMARGS